MLKASSVPPLLLSFAASLLGENLDLLVPQRWRQWRHFLLGGFAVSTRPALWPWGVYLTHLVLATRSSPLSPTPLILPSLHFTRHHIWLHRSFSLADALPPCWSKSVQVDALPPLNGCAFWWMLCHLLVWVDALPLWFVFSFGGCFAAGDLGAVTKAVQPLCCWVSICRFWFWRWCGHLWFVGCGACCSPRVACCCACCGCVFSRLCAFFQCFSVFSPLCSCVGQVLFGRIKNVFVTAFFLMKNVLRHGCEKKKRMEYDKSSEDLKCSCFRLL